MIDWTSGSMLRKKHQNVHPLISSNFVMTSDNKSYQNVVANLFEECIIIQTKKNQSLIKLNFQKSLLFEVIRFKDEEKANGTPRSLRFQYFEKWLQLKNSSICDQLEKWASVLAKKINQKGFHDQFQAVKKIGKGGFASVYLVKKKLNNQKFAVKAFSKQGLLSQSKGFQALQRQIAVMRELEHKNLMKLFQVYQTQNSVYLCVELLSGGSLFERIKKKGKFSSQQIKTILRSCLEGLEYMHSKNIMHRDLKPQNILFRSSQSDQCVIADFGLGEHCDKKDYIFSRCGTPGYVAPEVANLKSNNCANYSYQCDIFSLGVIFHILALKKPPFGGKCYNQVLINNRNCVIDFNLPHYKKLPASWLQLMMKMLEKDPKKRITASQALQSDFFAEDGLFKDLTEKRRNDTRESILSSSQKLKSTQTYASNILLTTDQSKKRNFNIRQDSCMKFKMRDNILMDKVDGSRDNMDECDSPNIIRKSMRRSGESRFKTRA